MRKKNIFPEKRKVALLTIAVIILVAGDRPGICFHIAYKGVGVGAAVRCDRQTVTVNTSIRGAPQINQMVVSNISSSLTPDSVLIGRVGYRVCRKRHYPQYPDPLHRPGPSFDHFKYLHQMGPIELNLQGKRDRKGKLVDAVAKL